MKLEIIAVREICKMIFCIQLRIIFSKETEVHTRSPQIHHQQLRFSHLFDRIAQAFASQTRVFHSAIRHVIDAETWHIARNDPANFQLVVGLKNAIRVTGKHTRLQTIG